ncbi:MAG: helix-turn-helix transcriptional regulator [Alistipes sp.]
MREKLLNLMKSEGLSSSRLAEILEIQPSGISHILSGRNKPGFDLLQKILRRFPRINPDWLLLDSEVMFRDSETATSPVEGRDMFDLSARPEMLTSNTQRPTSDSPATTLPQQPLQRAASAAEVVRVTVFYADQTFESFSPKK